MRIRGNCVTPALILHANSEVEGSDLSANIAYIPNLQSSINVEFLYYLISPMLWCYLSIFTVLNKFIVK